MAHSGTGKSKQKIVLALTAALGLVAADLYRSARQAAPMTLSAQGAGPILPLAADARGDVPLLASAARDPDILNKKPEDDNDASRLAAEMKEIRADLSRSQGERAVELNEQAYADGLALAYYFQDQGAKGQASLANVRTLVLQHTAALQTLTKNESIKAKAQFHANALNVVTGQDRAKAVANLEILAKGKLPSALKARAQLLVAIYALESGRPADRNKALNTINAAAKSVSGDGQIAVRLIAARAAAGLSKNGQRVANPVPAYKGHLAAVAKNAASLTDAKKAQVFRFMVGVWRAAEGNDGAWDHAPFSLQPFDGLIETKALAERAALAAWAKNDRATALKKYQALSADLAGRAEKAPVDLRILDFYRADYAATKNARNYEQALIRTSKSYLDPGALGDQGEARVKAMALEIARRHEALVVGEIARVSSPNASKQERLNAIEITKTFVLQIDDKAKIETMQAQIGGLYALNGQHHEAVAVYKELADAASGAKQAQYIRLAIASQSVLAQWPKDAPWNGFAAGGQQEREELLGFYQRLGGDWATLAHTGLLQTALGQTEQAFVAWNAALKKDARGPHAANAAGYMLVAHQKGGEWTALETLSRFCLKAPVAAVFRGKAVPVMEFFELALLEGGKAALESGQFKVAVAKLKEFTEGHPKAKNHDEGFFLLATAYRGNGQHKDSIQTLLSFVERYPASKYFRQALLNGGDWSAPMAYEDNAMFFYGKFVGQFAADPEATRVRDLLTELYLGRGLYSEALAMLDATVKAPGLTAEKKADALVKTMDIEERQGSPERADKAADLLIAASDAPEATKAEAFSVKARNFARKGNVAGLRAVEQRVTALGTGSAEAQQALGETRYFLAVATSKAVIQKSFNLALTDPTQTLEQRFAGFAAARTAFQSVCAAGQSSFCAPAMHKLARIGEDFAKTLEDIAIQETLSKDAVARFKARKQTIMNDVMRVVQASDDRAVAVVGQGYTDPDWTQAVLWQNSADWNFERVSGEAGNGYVQWSSGKAAE